VFGLQCAPVSLEHHQPRLDEGVALVEAELAIVMGNQQSWLMLARPDVLDWIEPA